MEESNAVGGRVAAGHMAEAMQGLQNSSLSSTFRQSPSMSPVDDRGRMVTELMRNDLQGLQNSSLPGTFRLSPPESPVDYRAQARMLVELIAQKMQRTQGSNLRRTFRQPRSMPPVDDLGRMVTGMVENARRGLQDSSLPSNARQSPEADDRGSVDDPEGPEEEADPEELDGDDDDSNPEEEWPPAEADPDVVEEVYAKASASLKIVVAFCRDELNRELRDFQAGILPPSLYEKYGAQLVGRERQYVSNLPTMMFIMEEDGKTPLISQRAQVNTRILLEQLPWLDELRARRKSVQYIHDASKTSRSAWKKVKIDLSKLVRLVESPELREEIAEAIMNNVFRNSLDSPEDEEAEDEIMEDD